VYLTNAAGTNDAKVTSSGRLKVQTAGKANVNVVNSHRTLWDTSLTIKQGDEGTKDAVPVESVPTGQALIVTDIVMNHNIKTTTAIHRGTIYRGSAGNAVACDNADSVLIPFVEPGGFQSIHLNTGIRFGPGEQLCYEHQLRDRLLLQRVFYRRVSRVACHTLVSVPKRGTEETQRLPK
jgi:hypothetical protein